jgi:hypothetical protein
VQCSNTDSQVVYRQLGYSTARAREHSSALYGAGSGRIWLDDVQCYGTESRRQTADTLLEEKTTVYTAKTS